MKEYREKLSLTSDPSLHTHKTPQNYLTSSNFKLSSGSIGGTILKKICHFAISEITRLGPIPRKRHETTLNRLRVEVLNSFFVWVYISTETKYTTHPVRPYTEFFMRQPPTAERPADWETFRLGRRDSRTRVKTTNVCAKNCTSVTRWPSRFVPRPEIYENAPNHKK